jgi:hypothetical protein
VIHDLDDVSVCQICAGYGYLKTIDSNENEVDSNCSSCRGDGYVRPFSSPPKKYSSKNKVIELALAVITQKETKLC